MTRVKFHFNRLILTLIFGIWASEPPPPPPPLSLSLAWRTTLRDEKVVLRRAPPCSLTLGIHYTVIWSAAVQYLIYLTRDNWYQMKHKLNPISLLLCEKHQILYKHQSKQLFYHSFPNFSHVLLTVIRSNLNRSIMQDGPYSSFSNFVWKRGFG